MTLVFPLSYNPIKSKGFADENHFFLDLVIHSLNAACPGSVNPLPTVMHLKRCELMMILNTQHTALIRFFVLTVLA